MGPPAGRRLARRVLRSIPYHCSAGMQQQPRYAAAVPHRQG